VLYQL